MKHNQMHRMRFAISIPQFYADGDFDPNAFRAHLTRVGQLGFDSAWTQGFAVRPDRSPNPL
jgi:hypothetical protein